MGFLCSPSPLGQRRSFHGGSPASFQLAMLFSLGVAPFKVVRWRLSSSTTGVGRVSYYKKVASFANRLSQLFINQELEKKRKDRSQVAYERKKQLTKLRINAQKAAEEKLGSQLNALDSVKY